MIDKKRKLLEDYLKNIDSEDIKKIALKSLSIEKMQDKPKTERIRNIKSFIQKIADNEDN